MEGLGCPLFRMDKPTLAQQEEGIFAMCCNVDARVSVAFPVVQNV